MYLLVYMYRLICKLNVRSSLGFLLFLLLLLLFLFLLFFLPFPLLLFFVLLFPEVVMQMVPCHFIFTLCCDVIVQNQHLIGLKVKKNKKHLVCSLLFIFLLFLFLLLFLLLPVK